MAEAGEGSAELDNAGLLKRAALRIESLEQQLMWREEKMAHAVSAQKELRERVLQYHNDFAREKEEIFDVASDMTRQYKGMQEELLSRINLLEGTVRLAPLPPRPVLVLGTHITQPLLAGRARYTAPPAPQINELKDQLEGSRQQLEETRREKAQVPRARHARSRHKASVGTPKARPGLSVSHAPARAGAGPQGRRDRGAEAEDGGHGGRVWRDAQGDS